MNGGELDAVLRAQHAKRHAGCPSVCFRVEKGRALPIGDFRKVWQSRCVKLGLGAITSEKDMKDAGSKVEMYLTAKSGEGSGKMAESAPRKESAKTSPVM
jgi:hypothetical protein